MYEKGQEVFLFIKKNRFEKHDIESYIPRELSKDE